MKIFDSIWMIAIITVLGFSSCGKNHDSMITPPTPTLNYTKASVDGIVVKNGATTMSPIKPTIKFSFTDPIQQASAGNGVLLKKGTQEIACNITFEDNNSTIVVKPKAALNALSTYTISVASDLLSNTSGKELGYPINITLNTGIDSSDKFTRISDNELLTIVQQQTFKYVWDYAHPVSGMIREGSKHGAEIVTSGGTGFGVMAIIVGIERGFISRADGLARLTKITKFLDEKAEHFHGAFSHWINGETGASIPFASSNNSGDILETSLLMQGLLAARQYFTGAGEEAELKARINKLWNNVEWDWYRQNNQNVLYWSWFPSTQWTETMKIQGWNEGLITYVLAASSTTHTIPKEVYTQGWTQNGAIKNGNTYYGVKLPLGDTYGGPLFFAHYSFLGLDPRDLTDDMGINYWEQNVAHSQINQKYCIDNPNRYYGYSAECWGLTASNATDGYNASSPTNDVGSIAPTAALSSFPYTPAESKKALEFFYYKLGDRLWGEYGFFDAFCLNRQWFSDAALAIDQGPIIVMMENYRTGLLWKLFMSAPEVKVGLKKLGFQSPKI